MQAHLFEEEVKHSERMRPLRPRQIQAIEDVKRAIAEGHRRIILQAAVGWGKTLWSAHVISSALQKGTRPLFTCPAISLVDQTLRSFEAEGIHDIGVMQAQHHRTNMYARVQIATLQTLERRRMPDVGMVIVDEVHESREAFNTLLDSPEWVDKIVIGLSATPWARGMGLRWTKLIVAGTIRDMINDGFAHEYPIYGPEKEIDRDELKTKNGEFEENSASSAMSDATIIGDVLKEWKERSTGDKTFAFCVNRNHAKLQIEAFADAGISFGYIDANTPQGVGDNEKGTRKHIFKQMQAGEIAGIASVGCLIRGVDEVVNNILDLQPTKSEMRHVQKWGRMRTPDPDAIYIGLDHAGNNNHLGLFTDIYHGSLDCRQPGERGEAYSDEPKPAKPRKCPKCHQIVPPGLRQCPTCNERLPLHTGITMKDGRLVDISSLPKITKEQENWLRELKMIADKSGYKNGWIRHTFEERWKIKAPSIPARGKSPTDEVKKFVRDRRKQYIQENKQQEIVVQ